MSQPDFVSELKARREPSGEIRGDSEIEPRWVIWLLVGPVVIHHPDFLVPAAAAHEVNLALRNAGNAAAQAEDNLVRELVRDDAGRVGGGRVLILLAQHLRRRDVLDVVEPALHGHVVAGHAQIAERQHGRIRRRRIPGLKLHVCRIARNRQRIEALRNHVEDAGIVQIIPQSVVENLEQVGILGVLRWKV